MSYVRVNLRMLILCVFFVCAGIIFCTSTTYAVNYNEVENNDYVSGADTITVNTGDSLNGYLTKGDVDWFKFTLKQGSEIELESYFYTDGYSLYYTVYSEEDVFNSDWCIEEQAEYNGNLGYVYGSDKLYLGKGTHYVRLTSYDTGNYTLAFNNTTVCEGFSEPNEYINQATTIKSGIAYKGILTGCEGTHIQRNELGYTGQDIDIFKITASSAGEYYFTMNNMNIDNCFAGGNLRTTALNSSGTSVNRFIDPDYGNYASNYTSVETRETIKMKLPKGTTYFKVQGEYGGKYVMSVTRKPTKVYYPDAIKSGSKNIKIKWQKKDGVTGYKIYRSTKKNSGYKLIKTIKNNKTTSYLDKNKKKGRTYYYKIRAYKYVNGYSCLGYYSRVESIRR